MFYSILKYLSFHKSEIVYFALPFFTDELTTKQVFTTELIEGIPVDQCADFTQGDRNDICLNIMRLCITEMFVFRYMQTDSNWSNFFYIPERKQVCIDSLLPSVR